MTGRNIEARVWETELMSSVPRFSFQLMCKRTQGASGLDVADMCKSALLIGKDIRFFPYKGKY